MVVNSAMASIMGMHREELLARFARREVPLLIPQIDLLPVLATNYGESRGAQSLVFVILGDYSD